LGTSSFAYSSVFLELRVVPRELNL
jgi:hypothetical protein